MAEPITMAAQDKLVILTGAGISAESGVKTFRDNDGLWENHRIEDVATPEAFHRDPVLVWRFYHLRREQLKQVKPNPGHQAVALLEERLGPERFYLVTQNVDDLHERGGSKQVMHMHGELFKIRCTQCHTVQHDEAAVFGEGEITKETLPHCDQCKGLLRPHIVWFGEVPFSMDAIQQALSQCTVFMAIGTSGVVYPAAGFLSMAKQLGAKTIGVNLEPPENHALFDIFYQGKSGEVLPEWVESLNLSFSVS